MCLRDRIAAFAIQVVISNTFTNILEMAAPSESVASSSRESTKSEQGTPDGKYRNKSTK